MTRPSDVRRDPLPSSARQAATLSAALDVRHGKVMGQCQHRHARAQWIKILRTIDRETPKGKTLHLNRTQDCTRVTLCHPAS